MSVLPTHFFKTASTWLLLLLVAAPFGLPGAIAAGDTTTIRLGTLLPSGTAQHQSLQALAEEWHKLSGGSLKLVLYPDGRLGGESEMVKKMRIKQLNACVLTAVGLSELDPDIAGLQVIPLAFRTWEEVDYVREKIRPKLEQHLRTKGFEVLFWGDAGWVRFFSKQPGIRPDDFKKMKLFTWTGDVRQAEIMKSIGYRPVALETSDILLGLNTDMINVVPVPPLIALAGQLYGPAPHMLDLNWSPIVGAAVIRRDVWDKIPAELQVKLRAAGEVAGEKIRVQSRDESEKSITAMQSHGLKIQTIPPEFMDEWRQLGSLVQSKVRGNMVPEDIFDEVMRLLAEYRKEAGASSPNPLMDPGLLEEHPSQRPTGFWHQAENLLITVALTVMVVLPVLEIIMRAGWNAGVTGSSTIVQHLTLAVGMLGGALAAREGRLLALSTATTLLPASWKGRTNWFSQSFSAAITLLLCVASVQFVLAEKEGGSTLLPGVPLWIIQTILPLGFAAITLRLIFRAARGWGGRLRAVLFVAAVLAFGIWTPWATENLVWPAMLVLLAATFLGAPVFVTLGGAGLILFWGVDQPIAALPVEHYRLVTNPALPSIPLFTLAGYFMAEGGASRRLVRVFQALVGWFRGGPAIATALLCAFFTSLTGGSGVTILALGGLLMPVLIAAKYTERDALGLLTGAGSLGILLPPCLPVILYAIIAKVGIKEMFLGGLIPGLLLIAMTAAWGIWAGRHSAAKRANFDFAEARAAVWSAKWELLLPVVSLGALFSGWATPVEAAAVTACYAFVIEVIIHRDLHIFRDCPRVLTEAGLLIGGILLILGVALGLTNYFIDAQLPDTLAAWAALHIKSRWLFLLGLNLVLLVVGGLIEIYAAIVVVVPLLVPIGLSLGLHPVHLGIIFLANMELGFLMPPVGLNLLLASSRLKKPIGETIRAVLPLLLVMLIGVLLITYCPILTTMLLP